MYDSKKDTKDHIEKVYHLIFLIVSELIHRAEAHDLTKLVSPEKEIFDKYNPLLRSVEYGSNEYNEYLKEMSVGLQYHFDKNRHHPEHFEWGIHSMTLIDIIEMFCDWKAASMRNEVDDFAAGLEINRDRFDVEDQLQNIFMNTAKEFDLF